VVIGDRLYVPLGEFNPAVEVEFVSFGVEDVIDFAKGYRRPARM
jgi:hypothetical protein